MRNSTNQHISCNQEVRKLPVSCILYPVSYSWLLAIVFCLLFSSRLFAGQNIVSLYNQGNKAYADGDYAQAITNYEEAISLGARDADLFFNLGSAYFKKGDAGHSILNYLRSLYLEPRAKDVKFNLAFARGIRRDAIKSIYSGFIFRLYTAILFFFSSSELIYIIIFLSLLLTIFITLYILKRLPGFKTAYIILGIVLFIFALIFTLKLSDDWFMKRAVVITDEVKAYSAPHKDSELLFVIHSGTELVEVANRVEWLKIKLEDGKEGWIMPDGVERVLLK